MLRRALVPLAVFVLLPLASRADTVSFQNGVGGYAGAQDTFLAQDGIRDQQNWGGRYDLYVGPFSGGPTADEVNRSLIRFDVSALAGVYAEITSITLRFTIEGTGAVGNTVELYQPAAANGDWVEGVSDGAVEAGASSWANKQEPATAWTGGGGLGSTGFGALLASASFAPQASGLLELSILDAGVATALIDDFLSGANEGFFLKAQDESHPGLRSDIRLFSSDHADVTERPMLIVEYTPVPEPSAALLVAAGATLLALRRR